MQIDCAVVSNVQQSQTYLQFVLLAVNNDSADLLVHEDEDSDE